MGTIDHLNYDYLKTAYIDTREDANIYTDLAIEATEMLSRKMGQAQIPGVESVTESIAEGTLTRVQVKNDLASQQLGKKPGRYVTFESSRLQERDKDYQETISKTLGKELQQMIGLPEQDMQKTALVIGLGNWRATPDALGPRTIGKILITRHLIQYHGAQNYPGLRPVCAIAPGVLGITGIETAEIVQGIVQKIRPDFVIVIDALAAQSSRRVAATIQMADTGIQPGAGIGNKRSGLNQESLGVPVFAVGVPTVVEAMTIANDAMEQVNGANQQQNPLDKNRVMRQILAPFFGSMIVTPKEIDVLIEDMAQTVANIINIALHPTVDPEEFFRYA